MMGFWDGSGINWTIPYSNNLHLLPDHANTSSLGFTGWMLKALKAVTE